MYICVCLGSGGVKQETRWRGLEGEVERVRRVYVGRGIQ